MELTPIANVTAADAARTGNGANRTRAAGQAGGFGVALDAALHRREASPAPANTPVREARPDDEADAAERNLAALLVAGRQASAQRSARPAAREWTGAGALVALDAAPAEGKALTVDAEATAGGESAAAAAGRVMADTADAAKVSADAAAAIASAAPPASADAAAGPTPTPAPDVRAIERSLDSLEPVFRERLDRVIERLEAEGHEVRVLETYRDPARQDFLFAQGRSRPGPVVTWTRDSNHTHGRAADLMIDGSYDNPQGYARLATIAAEEGLRSLGARDPGHIELASNAQEPRPLPSETAGTRVVDASFDRLFGSASVARVAEVAQVAAVGGVARVAEVAEPAAAAHVAQVARVAQVATPGAAGLTSEVEGVRVAMTTGAAAPGSAERAARVALDASMIDAATAPAGPTEAVAKSSAEGSALASIDRLLGARVDALRAAGGPAETAAVRGPEAGPLRPVRSADAIASVEAPAAAADGVAAQATGPEAAATVSPRAAMRGTPEAVAAAAAAAVPEDVLAAALASAHGAARVRPARSADGVEKPAIVTAPSDAAATDGGPSESGTRAEPSATGEPVQRVERAGWTAEPTALRTATTPASASAVERADVAGRAERVAALQDAAAMQPLSQVTLRVDGENGEDARIRVGLRGTTVGASIETADPAAAASLRAHVAELREALERRGLDPSTLMVRAAARSGEPGDVARLASVLAMGDPAAPLAPARDSSPQREAGQQHSHSTPRRDADTQRQKQDRQHKEEDK